MNKFTNIACSTIKTVASADLSVSNDLSNNNDKTIKDLLYAQQEKETEQTENTTEDNKKNPNKITE